MNKSFSLTTLVVSYGLALGLFALLCPAGELQQGLVFQVIVLVLASEAWNFLWWLPSLFLMFREAKQQKEEKRYTKMAKLTSPILLVVPPLLYLAMAGLSMVLPSGSLAEACGFADMGALFKASYASVVLLFVAALFFPLFPFSFTNFGEYFHWDSPLRADRGMVDAPQPAAADAEVSGTTHDALPQHHSVSYAQNLATLQSLMQEGEELVYATAPQVELLWRRSGKGAVSTAVCLVTLAVGLGGLVGLTQVTDSSLRLFCGVLALLGLVMGVWSYRAIRTEKKRLATCDYFLTTKRFCRLNATDKPKSIFWEKDKPNISLSQIPGTDVGNIHISPTSGFVSRLMTTFGGDSFSKKSEKQGELEGMEYIAACVPVHALVQQLNTPSSVEK